MSTSKRVLISLGCILCTAALTLLLVLDRYTLSQQVFTFASTYKGKPVSLQATLYEQPQAEYAVLVCPGYSCDRQKWQPFINGIAAQGITVMIFDYSGQGGSTGTIGFDNAKTDQVPVQIDDAIGALMQKTGLPEENIILLGHSMGGRGILRLLCDYNRPGMETTIKKRQIRNVILLSPQVNYLHSAQASLFAGTKDETAEPWLSLSEKDIEGTNVYLFGSTADDVVSDGCILALYRHLGAADVPQAGTYSAMEQNSLGSRLTVQVTSGVLHSYQMVSSQFSSYTLQALQDITGRESADVSGELSPMIYTGWGAALLGISLLLAGLNRGRDEDSLRGCDSEENELALLDAKKYLLRKALLWPVGLIMAFALCCLCVVMPFGSPIMNIPYMCFISGYGLVMLAAYRKGRFAGTQGRLPRVFVLRRITKKEAAVTVMITAGVLMYVWAAVRLTMYRLPPLNLRLVWLLICTVLMTIGFYVSGAEEDMLARAGVKRLHRLLYGFIQYLPLLLFVLFYLVIGSYSGLIGQILNVLLMYILFVPLGTFVRRSTGSRFLGALVTAFAFQMFMITSAALIAM